MPRMTDSGLVALLKQAASRLRSRVVDVTLYDPNVGISGVDWRDALDNRPPRPDWFRHQLKVTVDGQRVTIRSNDRFIALDIRGRFEGVPPFSVNRPDRVVPGVEKPVGLIGTRKWPLFSPAAADTRTLLTRPLVRDAVEAFDLSEGESIHVYQNGVTVYVQPGSLEQLLDAISRTAALVSQMPTVEDRAMDLADLPAEFSVLVPLIRKWAESDDAVREDRLGRASSADLRMLAAAVAPYFESINAYLDSFHERAVPESAAALGALAECSTEAQLALAKRGAGGA